MSQKRLIDVIIPYYNAADTLGQTLASIAMQSVTDKIEVLILDDYSVEGNEALDRLVEHFRAFFPINVFRMDKNRGPGECRQKGIQITECPYIVFVDADDQLASKYSLEVMLNEMQTNRYNLLLTDFQEEVVNASPLTFSIHRQDMTWVFAKLYRRSVLEEYDIHFNPAGSYANEDSGFNALLSLSIDPASIGYAPFVTYTWTKRPDSITRRNNCEYNYTTGLGGFVVNQKYAIEQASRRGKVDQQRLLTHTISVLATCYKTYSECLLSDKHRSKLPIVMKHSLDFFRAYSDYLIPAIFDSPFFRRCADMVPPHYLLLCSPYEFIGQLDVGHEYGFYPERLVREHRLQRWQQ